MRVLLSATALLTAIACLGCQAGSGTSAAASTGIAYARSSRSHSTQHAKSTKHTKAVPKPKDVPAHVQTVEYLWSPAEQAADPSRYAPYLTWAYPLFPKFAAVKRAGIKTILYVNPLMPEPGGTYEFPAITGKYSNLQARDCSGNAVRAYNGTSYLLDVRTAEAPQAVREMVQGYVRSVKAKNPDDADPIDLMFVDNANSFYGVTPMPCNFDQDRWTDGVASALSQTGYPTVVNSLSVAPESIPAKVKALRGRNIAGEMYEACFVDTRWTAEEIAQLQTVRALRALHKKPGLGFWCYVNGTPTAADASAVTGQRLFDYASFLLTYDPSYSAYQSAYHSPPSTFKVLPETQFVPLEPLQRVDNLDELRSPAGAYVREYRFCYYRRKLVGACEIAVNPNPGIVDIPRHSAYHHSVSLAGNGVLDGGTVSFNGPDVDHLDPDTAAILVP